MLDIYEDIISGFDHAIDDSNKVNIIQSIKEGALRISGGLLPDKDTYEVQNKNFALKIYKMSKDSLIAEGDF